MNKPSKCKNCEWYGKPYWSVINPCDNCQRENYYQVMDTYYTEEFVKSLLKEIEQLQNRIIELEEINKQHQELNGELRERIDKAIEYMKQHEKDGTLWLVKSTDDLLNILKDKEEV